MTPQSAVSAFIGSCRRYVKHGIPSVYDTVPSAYDELFPSHLPWGRGMAKDAARILLGGKYHRTFARIQRKHGYNMLAAVMVWASASGVDLAQFATPVMMRHVNAKDVHARG